MVKLHKITRDGCDPSTMQGTYRTIFGCGIIKGNRRKRLVRLKALKMLSRAGPVGGSTDITNGTEQKEIAMTGENESGSVTPGNYESHEGSKEFLLTGRTGRRNALPDILGPHSETGISDLPARFQELSTTPGESRGPRDPNMPSTSKQRTG